MEPVNFRNGTYSGVWGGYVIEVNIRDKKIELTTETGVRGLNIPVLVTLVDGVWTATHRGYPVKIKKVDIYSKEQ